MDPFQILPVDVIESIPKLLPDLTSLHRLYNASPGVASLIHEDGLTPAIIETIMSQDLPSTQFLVRSISLVQWRSTRTGLKDAANDNPLPSSWDAIIAPHNQWNRGGRPIPADYSDVPLPKSIPPSILCRVLALSTRVRQLTHACLHDMITRCLALEPMHLKDPTFKYRRRTSFEKRTRRPEGLPYQPVDSGTPSWAEEQRVAGAIWRIAFFFELKDAIVVRDLLDWEEEDVQLWRVLGAEEFWHELLTGGQAMEQETVLKWIFPADTAPGNERLQLPGKLYTVSMGEWIYCCQKIKPPATEEESMEAKKCLTNDYSAGYAFGKQALTNQYGSPLRHVEFEVFRPYGFAIWDKTRMVALGFLESFTRDGRPQNSLITESNLFFTQESILTKDQLEEVERKQKGKWP